MITSYGFLHVTVCYSVASRVHQRRVLRGMVTGLYSLRHE